MRDLEPRVVVLGATTPYRRGTPPAFMRWLRSAYTRLEGYRWDVYVRNFEGGN